MQLQMRQVPRCNKDGFSSPEKTSVETQPIPGTLTIIFEGDTVMSSNNDHGYGEAVFATTTIGAIASLSTKYLASWLLYPLVGTILAYLVIALVILYIFASGVRQVPVGFRGIKLILGERTGKTYTEGWAWNYPEPFGDIMVVDTRDKPFNIPTDEVLTKDRVPINITVTLQTNIIDLYAYLSTDFPEISLQNLLQSNIRIAILDITSEEINGKRQELGDQILKVIAKESEKKWGIAISQVQVTDISLPKEIQGARIKVQVAKTRQEFETEQAIAERIEAEHVVKLITLYNEAGLDITLAANVVQSERGKATRIILDGSGSSLEKAGALAGGILNQTKNNH